MKKYIIGVLLIFSFLVPAVSFAQVASEDIAMPPLTCYNIVNNLKYKDRDITKNGEVTILQNFLRSKKFMTANSTGYFGVLTLKAVKNLQRANSINPTGFVGPITRAKIKALTCAVSNSSVTVVSPNGGESLAQGTKHTIRWTDSSMSPQAKRYDIKLATYQSPCLEFSGSICPMTNSLTPEPRTIATKVLGSSYDWTIPKCTSENPCSSNFQIVNGQYKIEVCQSNTTLCDSSDNYFSIVSDNKIGYLYISPSSVDVTTGNTKTLQAMYQPPMPTCLTGFACAQVMPAPYVVEADWNSGDIKIATVAYKDNCPPGAQCFVYQPDKKTIVVTGVSSGTTDISAAYTAYPSGGGTSLPFGAKAEVRVTAN